MLQLGTYSTNMSAMTSIFVETGDGMVGCILILLAIYENVLAELLEIQNLCHFAVQDQRGVLLYV